VSFTNLLRHRVRVARPPSAGAVDGYGNPTGALVEDVRDRPAFVQQDGKSEVAGEGDDSVIADYSVYLDPRDGAAPDTGCDLVWRRSGQDDRALGVLAVREEQGPGFTHHLRVLCREAPAPTDP
jgi:hypothetical protein